MAGIEPVWNCWDDSAQGADLRERAECGLSWRVPLAVLVDGVNSPGRQATTVRAGGAAAVVGRGMRRSWLARGAGSLGATYVKLDVRHDGRTVEPWPSIRNRC